MITLFEWSPLLLYAGCAAALSGINYLLYRRWRTKNYFILFMEAALIFMISLSIYVAAASNPSNTRLLSTAFALSLLQYIVVQAGLHYYFLKATPKQLIIHFVAVICTLIGFTIFIFNTLLGLLVTVLIGISYIAVLFIHFIPKLPKRKFYWTSHLLFTAGLLFQAVTIQWQPVGTWFLGLLILAGSQFVMLLIFYDRIVDMVEAGSYHSVTDGLTGLYNRSHFTKKVNDYLDNGTAQALIFVDIDNFKIVNDQQGHQVGDEILKLVAKTLKNTVQDYGITGRYGGEEMVAIITSQSADPGELAEQFRAQVEKASVDITPITVSVGYSIHENNIMADELFKQADDALYKAKSRGKNRVVSHQRF